MLKFSFFVFLLMQVVVEEKEHGEDYLIWMMTMSLTQTIQITVALR